MLCIAADTTILFQSGKKFWSTRQTGGLHVAKKRKGEHLQQSQKATEADTRAAQAMQCAAWVWCNHSVHNLNTHDIMGLRNVAHKCFWSCQHETLSIQLIHFQEYQTLYLNSHVLAAKLSPNGPHAIHLQATRFLDRQELFISDEDVSKLCAWVCLYVNDVYELPLIRDLYTYHSCQIRSG